MASIDNGDGGFEPLDPFSGTDVVTTPIPTTETKPTSTTRPPPLEPDAPGSLAASTLYNTSNNLYLYTFLTTISVLIAAAVAVVLRSAILRRRYRLAVEQAIEAGWLSPSGGKDRPKKERPLMWEAWIMRPHPEQEESVWEDLKVIALAPPTAPQRKPSTLPPTVLHALGISPSNGNRPRGLITHLLGRPRYPSVSHIARNYQARLRREEEQRLRREQRQRGLPDEPRDRSPGRSTAMAPTTTSQPVDPLSLIRQPDPQSRVPPGTPPSPTRCTTNPLPLSNPPVLPTPMTISLGPNPSLQLSVLILMPSANRPYCTAPAPVPTPPRPPDTKSPLSILYHLPTSKGKQKEVNDSEDEWEVHDDQWPDLLDGELPELSFGVAVLPVKSATPTGGHPRVQ